MRSILILHVIRWCSLFAIWMIQHTCILLHDSPHPDERHASGHLQPATGNLTSLTAMRMCPFGCTCQHVWTRHMLVCIHSIGTNEQSVSEHYCVSLLAPGSLARSKNKHSVAWRLGYVRVRPTICTQLDWATAGTQLGAPDVLRRTPDSFEKIFGRSSKWSSEWSWRCTCIASRSPSPCIPSPRCQRGCWCTQRCAIFSC